MSLQLEFLEISAASEGGHPWVVRNVRNTGTRANRYGLHIVTLEDPSVTLCGLAEGGGRVFQGLRRGSLDEITCKICAKKFRELSPEQIFLSQVAEMRRILRKVGRVT